MEEAATSRLSGAVGEAEVDIPRSVIKEVSFTWQEKMGIYDEGKKDSKTKFTEVPTDLSPSAAVTRSEATAQASSFLKG